MHASSLLAIGLTGLALIATPPARGDAVLDWNTHLDEIIFAAGVPVPAQPRSAAIVHLAIFDAVNGIDRRYAPYHVQQTAPAGARIEAAAVQAGYTTLRTLYPAHASVLDAHRAASLAKIPGSQGRNPSIELGLQWGEYVAHRILELRSDDGWAEPQVPYFGGFETGQWRSLPVGENADGTLPAVFPQMAVLTPFAMPHPGFLRPGPPYGVGIPEALLTARYAEDLEEVKAIGRVDSPVRRAEQSDAARMWQAIGCIDENRPVRSIVPANARLVDKARLFALINMAACDGLIIGWDSKFAYHLWRPHHAIRLADTDGNPETTADPEWTGLILAPRFPEYVSNHSTMTAAIMRVLARELGDEHSFTLGSPLLPGISQSYTRFSDAAAQAREARIWGGIHFREACEMGEALGVVLADYLLENYLTPRPVGRGSAVGPGNPGPDGTRRGASEP